MKRVPAAVAGGTVMLAESEVVPAAKAPVCAGETVAPPLAERAAVPVKPVTRLPTASRASRPSVKPAPPWKHEGAVSTK